MSLVRGDWFYIVLMVLDGFFMTRPYLYAIQNDNYRISEIFKHKRLRRVYLMDVITIVVFCALWLLFYLLNAKAFWGFLVALFFFITEFALYFMEDLPDRKKPLRYTKRAVRCLIFVTAFASTLGSVSLAIATHNLADEYLRYLVFFAYVLVFPPIFIASTGIINVFERLNNRRYEKKTAKRLEKRPDLIKIAITGSYGKTSVKNFLKEILSQKYNVLATPESYNTPMGIAKTVNTLNATHEVFIAEFGARRVGDIKRLMKIVKPKYSVLTGINVQHLETFKTFANIKREKCRILEVGDGACVINQDVREIAENYVTRLKRIPETIYAGLDEGADIYATNLYVSADGSEFDVVVGDDIYHARTRVLGIHNVQNIMLAVGMAIKLGVEMPYILNAIDALQPVAHRQQLIEGNGVTIIDDSFNSNPDGAKCALQTLALFDKRKVVVTPGFVELGEREGEENYVLGKRMSEVADVVLLIGKKRTESIKRGLKECGFHGEIFVYDSLKNCQDDFVNVLKLDDVMLILNDLPDVYDDKM